MIIKIGDDVLIYGEGNDVFTVIDVINGRALLHDGLSEPIEKCVKVPEIYRDDIYTTVMKHLPTDIAMKLFEDTK